MINGNFVEYFKPFGLTETVASRIGDLIENYCQWAIGEEVKEKAFARLQSYFTALNDCHMNGFLYTDELLWAIEDATLKEAIAKIKAMAAELA